MKAVAVAGGSPDTPETPDPEGTEVPATNPGTGDKNPPEHETPNPDNTKTPAPEANPAPTPPSNPGADPGAEADSEPGAEADLESAAAPDTGTAPEPAADADPAPAAKSAPEPGAKADPEPGADLDTETEPESAADVDPAAGAKSASEPGAGLGAEADSESGAEADFEPGADLDTETEPEPGADAGAEADPEPGAEADLGSAAAPDTGTAPEPASAADPASAAKSAPEPGADAGADPGADVDPESGAEADLESAAGPGTDTDPQPAAGVDPEPDSTTDPDSAADASPEAGAEGGAGVEPEAAEAAAGDEARPGAEPSGGAGSVSTPEPGPDAGGESRRVPSWARNGEADAERTSTFVALKGLDAPAKKATWPVAVPQHPTPTPGTGPGTGTGPAAVVEPTREVPAPPPPALGLLAELTNTPAPPETPRRTAVRRVKIWTPILLALAGAVAGAQLLRPLPEPRIVASDASYTLDGQFSVPWPAKGQGALRVPGSGDIGTFGEQKPVPTASVAKVMTAYVVLKGHPLRKGEPGPQIEIDAKAVADGTSEHESRIEGLVAGTKFSQQDMLKMLMIPSGNNVARLLARWDTGTDSEAAFVEKMNAAARELGMANTTYTDPSGLDAGTVSTATDQLKLAEAVMKDEAFRAVVALPSAEIKGLSTPLYNNNSLLTVNGLSIRGIKTGSSTPAGGTLMWAAYKSVGDETPLILGTLMDQHVDGPDPNAENSLTLVKANSKKIIEAVREALAPAPAIRKGQTVGHVDDGLGGSTPLVATKDLNVIGVPGQRLKLNLRPGAAKVPHTAKAGTEIGVLTIGDGEGAKSVPVAVGTELAEPSFGARVSRLG
ncbi:serine hydrolase [Streptomyces goshikiensis]|uniref:serine hydrolase n=1 Tax=Streptomyces goshikiensis TaxID=1942 RepID=UPI0036958130